MQFHFLGVDLHCQGKNHMRLSRHERLNSNIPPISNLARAHNMQIQLLCQFVLFNPVLHQSNEEIGHLEGLMVVNSNQQVIRSGSSKWCRNNQLQLSRLMQNI